MWRSALLSPRNLARMGGGLGLSAAVVAAQFGVNAVLMVAFAAIGLAAVGVSFLIDSLGASASGKQAREFARTNGWQYHASLPGVFAPLFTAPFDATESTYLHVVTGRFGGFDCYDGIYEWRKRIDDDNSITGRHRVAAVRLPDELPRLLLVPEGFTSRIAKAFGGTDVDFESSAFNRSWRVLADNPRVAHEMLGPRVIAKLEELDSKAPLLFERGLAVRIDDDSVGIDSLAERLGGILAVARFLPQHTIDDHGRLANSIGPLPSVSTPGALTHGYDPEMIAADAEYERTAKPRKQQKWIDAARSGTPPEEQPGTPVAFRPDAL